MRSVAWILGLAAAALCVLTLTWTIALGLYSPQALVLLMFALTGVIGGLITARQPGNSVGRLMIAGSLAANLFFAPLDYGYTALVLTNGSWPAGDVVLWMAAWLWSPVLGLFLPALLVRFPDGRIQSPWRFVDWVAAAGTLVWAFSIAIAPAAIVSGFLPVGDNGVALRVLALVQNPLGWTLPAATTGMIRIAGLALILLADVAAVASLMSRYARSRGDERLQIRWIAYAGALIATAFVYAGLSWIVLGQPLGNALLPADFASFALPLALGIAILRYRLYDIDLLINRSIVYLGVTAILGALYTAVITFLNRFVISASGQRSDAAYVVTAFVVVVAFSPVKDALQRRVDRRLGGARASASLEKFRTEVDSVVSVLDANRVACRLVDQAVLAFDAYGAELYLDAREEAVYCHGVVNGQGGISVRLQHEGVQYGRLVVGRRRGDVAYSSRDVAALQRSADSVGEALALAARIGPSPLSGRQEVGSSSAIRG